MGKSLWLTVAVLLAVANADFVCLTPTLADTDCSVPLGADRCFLEQVCLNGTIFVCSQDGTHVTVSYFGDARCSTRGSAAYFDTNVCTTFEGTPGSLTCGEWANVSVLTFFDQCGVPAPFL